ncbi:DUF1761 domain-containing protein [Candidatus Peregrinibacteria bacterium]|nr:DUF1761 domain-containing protein [Candidatus Peregrinibacteria bacterium]
MPEIPLNYTAIVIAAVLNMVVGFLWFGPLFGKHWIKMMGFTSADMEKAKKKGMAPTYVMAFVASLIMAFVLAHSLIFASDYLGVTGPMAGAQAGFWNWLGFIAPVTAGSVFWEEKSWKLWALTNGHYLVSLVLMGVVLAVM